MRSVDTLLAETRTGKSSEMGQGVYSETVWEKKLQRDRPRDSGNVH